MRPVIYKRVSSKQQAADDKASLAAQERECRAYCEQHGVVGDILVYSDDSTGETMTQRTGLHAAIAAIRAGQADTLVCNCVDRQGRDQLDNLLVLDEVTKAGGHLEFCDIGRIENTALGQFMLNTQSYVAQASLENIKRWTTNGKRGRAARGALFAVANPLYGYAWAGLKKEALVPDDVTAPIVTEIFKRAADGWSTRSIARWLNESGYATPSAYAQAGKRRVATLWKYSTIRDVLRNKSYTGQHSAYRYETWKVDGGEDDGKRRKRIRADGAVPIAIPSLVDQATFDKVQAMMTGRRMDRDLDTLAGEPLLNRGGLAYCGHCGGRMTKTPHNSRRYWQYMCCNRSGIPANKADTCAGRAYAVRCDTCDADVWAKVVAVAQDSEHVQRVLNGKMAKVIQRLEDWKRSYDNMLDKRKEMQEERDGWVHKIGRTNDEMLLAIYEPKLKEVQALLAALDRRIQEAEYTKDAQNIVLAFFQEAQRLVQGRTSDHEFTRDEKRVILRALGVTITMYATNSEFARTHDVRWDVKFDAGIGYPIVGTTRLSASR